MPAISKCPRCLQLVTLPEGVASDAEVRCPLCSETYPLSEAQAAVPPALIPVDKPSSEPPESEFLVKSDLISEPFHVPGEKVEVVPQIDAGDEETPEEPVDAEAFSIREDEEPAHQNVPVTGSLARPRKRGKKSKSPFRTVVEVIGGGFLGVLISYYLLAWTGFDVPEFPLPLLPHTMNRPAPPKDRPALETPSRPKPASAKNDEPDELVTLSDLSAAVEPAEPIEPEPDVEPTFEPPLEPDRVGPRQRPPLTGVELGAALKAAHESFQAVEPADDIRPATYEAFCRLGHVVAFATGDRLTDRKAAAEKMLRRMAESPTHLLQIERRAAELLQDDSPAHEGILLAGTIGKVSSQDGLFGTVVRMPTVGKSVALFSDGPLPFSESQRVVILGSIVRDPAENLVGYSGSKPLVVWLGMAVVVP